MGVFDFLYKPRQRPAPKGTNYRPKSATSSQYRQRTTIEVSRASSLPDEEIYNVRPNGRSEAKAPTHRSYNQKHHEMKKQNASKMDFVDYYHQSKKNEDLDDFSRLARLEIKLDDHMSRYFELTAEMNKIEQDLILIRREFYDEYQDYLLKKGNRPTVDLGGKILDKMNHYYSKLEEGRADAEPMEHLIPPTNVQSNKPTKQNENAELNYNQQHTQLQQQTQQHQKQQSKTVENVRSKHTSKRYYNNDVNNLAKSQPQLNQDFPMDISAIPPPNNDEMYKANYVMINSTQYEDDHSSPTRDVRVSHHQSTPSISLPPPPTQSPPPINQPQSNSRMSQMYNNDFYPSSSSQHSQKQPMYLNMSMAMHSSHPAIENSYRRIDVMRPRIMMYNAEHKLRSYHEMSHDLSSLMGHLETLDCGGSREFEQDRNIALCEIHNMVGMLERSILCDDPLCVLCNSFIYKEEVSV